MKYINHIFILVLVASMAACGGGGGGSNASEAVADVSGTYRIDATISENECEVFTFDGYFANPQVVVQQGDNITIDTGTTTVLDLGPARTPNGFSGQTTQELSPSLAVVFTVEWSAVSEGVYDVTYDFFRFPLTSMPCHVIWQGTATQLN